MHPFPSIRAVFTSSALTGFTTLTRVRWRSFQKRRPAQGPVLALRVLLARSLACKHRTLRCGYGGNVLRGRSVWVMGGNTNSGDPFCGRLVRTPQQTRCLIHLHPFHRTGQAISAGGVWAGDFLGRRTLSGPCSGCALKSHSPEARLRIAAPTGS